MLGLRTACRSFKNLRRYVHTGSLFPKKGDSVVVAMSGGVDSSVTAKLLADQDYDLSAVFMRNWDTRDESGTDTGCEWEKDWEDVQRVCKVLDIPCRMIDLSREYWTRVFEPSLAMWETGCTPNPDIWCNREVKFGALFDCLAPSSPWVATGHYTRKEWFNFPYVSFPPTSPPKDLELSLRPRPQLLRAEDTHKDQTYYLSAISEASLTKALFPLGNLTKIEVRDIAKKEGLPTAERSESMGICFVGEKRRFDQFVSQYIQPKPGSIVDLTSGQTVATHQGLWTYTIGQNAKIKGMPEKMFVARKNPAQNEIYVVPGPDHPELYSTTLVINDLNMIWPDYPLSVFEQPLGEGSEVRVQYRHRMTDVPATVRRGEQEGTLEITFKQPQKGVAPGQIATLYDGTWCLGCGVIRETHSAPTFDPAL